eukprot:1184391-Prorocentrum_minimum.AAC.2
MGENLERSRASFWKKGATGSSCLRGAERAWDLADEQGALLGVFLTDRFVTKFQEVCSGSKFRSKLRELYLRAKRVLTNSPVSSGGGHGAHGRSHRSLPGGGARRAGGLGSAPHAGQCHRARPAAALPGGPGRGGGPDEGGHGRPHLPVQTVRVLSSFYSSTNSYRFNRCGQDAYVACLVVPTGSRRANEEKEWLREEATEARRLAEEARGEVEHCLEYFERLQLDQAGHFPPNWIRELERQ